MAKKILIIEDEPDYLALLEHLLAGAGYSVVKAVNGEAGLKAFKEKKPDLVLLDLNLPDMDGLDVCRGIRAQEPPKTPILLCSVRSAVASVGEGLKAGADDYVLKPYDEADLLARIKARLKR
ncbi:MAG: response regulator transcription factor [Elusimicrobia bacterium]|nr:response regulator transcription factor [Elusimicrobiota bacterium]